MNMSLVQKGAPLTTGARSSFVGVFTLASALGGALATIVLFFAKGGADFLSSALIGINGGGALGVFVAGLITLIARDRVSRIPAWTTGMAGVIFGAIAAPIAFIAFLYAVWALAVGS